ncbi:MAG: ABC transporter permease [Actinomycetota bacterium]|nr:ABC transporter permease [Actinomycetota bacterium]
MRDSSPSACARRLGVTARAEAETSSPLLDDELAGLDALEVHEPQPKSLLGRIWAGAWPPLAAVALVIALWELVVLTGWRPEYAFPPPGRVFARFFTDIASGELLRATAVTMRRAAVGYGLALIIGCGLGIAIAHFKLLRKAFGALVTGLQTMPSIAWFPLALLLFQLGEGAILFVVILGAAPAVANGLINGIDHVPPVLLRAGKMMGARGLSAYRHVVLPAALPSFVGGLKQGWAFAWRSLMAGELLGVVANQDAIGFRLQLAREFSDVEGVVSTMILILLIGIIVDLLVFGTMEQAVKRRWGLIDPATAE